MISLRNENENSAGNFNSVIIKDVKFYFSYETIVWIAFWFNLYVHENDWSNTTGKHLNRLDWGDKKERLSAEDFAKKLEEAYKLI